MTHMGCEKGLQEAKGKISKAYKKREADDKIKIKIIPQKMQEEKQIGPGKSQ